MGNNYLKSRLMIGEAGNISCDRLYDWKQKKWISLGERQAIVFISTELTEEEVQSCLLAHISGIEEDRLVEWRDITLEEEQIINDSAKVIEESLFFGEYQCDFTIDSINETIERYIINKKIVAVYFDYINDSASMYKSFFEKTGMKLQTHQILFLFSNALKLICNKYQVHLRSATQLSSNYKEEKDANSLKGAKSIAEKCDGGVICLPATQEDLKKLQPIFNNGFYAQPNYAYFIYKNRGNKWNNLIVWTKMNLGTCREEGIFCTTMEYELISDIDPTTIGDFDLKDIGEVGLMEPEIEGTIGEFANEFKKIQASN